MKAERQKAEARGRRSEWIAAIWLMLRGWRLVARRVRTPLGEIDLIMRRGGQLAYIEVKARANLEEAHNALTARSLSRLSRAARLVLHNHDKQARLNHRCDAVLVVPGRFPRHIANVISFE